MIWEDGDDPIDWCVVCGKAPQALRSELCDGCLMVDDMAEDLEKDVMVTEQDELQYNPEYDGD